MFCKKHYITNGVRIYNPQYFYGDGKNDSKLTFWGHS